LKGREFAKLARRHLMPHLPGFALKDGRIYALPVERLLRKLIARARSAGINSRRTSWLS